MCQEMHCEMHSISDSLVTTITAVMLSIKILFTLSIDIPIIEIVCKGRGRLLHEASFGLQLLSAKLWMGCFTIRVHIWKATFSASLHREGIVLRKSICIHIKPRGMCTYTRSHVLTVRIDFITLTEMCISLTKLMSHLLIKALIWYDIKQSSLLMSWLASCLRMVRIRNTQLCNRIYVKRKHHNMRQTGKWRIPVRQGMSSPEQETLKAHH